MCDSRGSGAASTCWGDRQTQVRRPCPAAQERGPRRWGPQQHLQCEAGQQAGSSHHCRVFLGLLPPCPPSQEQMWAESQKPRSLQVPGFQGERRKGGGGGGEQSWEEEERGRRAEWGLRCEVSTFLATEPRRTCAGDLWRTLCVTPDPQTPTQGEGLSSSRPASPGLRFGLSPPPRPMQVLPWPEAAGFGSGAEIPRSSLKRRNLHIGVLLALSPFSPILTSGLLEGANLS